MRSATQITVTTFGIILGLAGLAACRREDSQRDPDQQGAWN